ncbi:unnamed protein product, partial [Ixodes persulcatus]
MERHVIPPRSQRVLSKREQEQLDRDACLERLKKLLRASSTYSQFLIQRIQQQNEETKARHQQRRRPKFKEIQVYRQVICTSCEPSNMTTQVGSLSNGGTPKSPQKTGPSSSLQVASKRKATPTTPSGMSLQTFASPLPGSCGGNDDLPEGQPTSFTGGTMRPYQIEGFRWLKVLYENGVNGILADEMGLGKTIQVIALVGHLADSGLPGPYLVVAPLSTLANWLAEFQRFTPSLTALLYHGTKEQRAELRVSALRRATVVLTSYEVAMCDRAKLAPLDWRLLVVDEAHRLKNFRCRLMRELAQYGAANRLLLTGTPLQNSLTELWALLHFLIPEIFHDLRAFESWFDMSSLSEGEGTRFVEQEQTNQLVGTMQEILRPFLLRRTKDEVELDLPTKTELLVYASLSPLQEKLYKICVDGAVKVATANGFKQEEDLDLSEQERGRPRRCRKSIRYVDPGEDDPWEDDASRSPGHVQEAATREPKDPLDELRHSRNPLMDLRKICNHPYLFRWVDPTGPADEELVAASGKLRLLDCMLPELRRRKHKVL